MKWKEAKVIKKECESSFCHCSCKHYQEDKFPGCAYRIDHHTVFPVNWKKKHFKKEKKGAV